jgi:N4-gp56 family major capsid protein
VADNLTQFSTVSVDAPAQYIARRMYELSERNLVLGRYATRYELPQAMGTTLRAVRVGRLALPRSPLTEGVAPDAVALSLTNQDVTVQQWGIVVLLTDVAELTTVHPMLTAAIERTALAMSEMFEREMAGTLMAGTNVTYATAVATRASLTATKIVTTAEMIGLATSLRRRGALPIKGTLYGGVLPPQMEADMMAESSFQNAIARGQELERLDFAKIGTWMGTEWVRSNFLPFFRGIAAPDGAAATDTKAQLVGVAGGTAYNANATVQVIIVGRDINSDYERLISQTSALAIGVGNQQFDVVLPSNAGYTWDIYAPSALDGSAPRLHTSHAVSSSTVSVTVKPSASAAVAKVAPASTVETYVAWVFGRDAFGRVELNGMSLRSYLTPAGASFSNPLAQGRKIGSKVMWNSWILDNAFFERFEAGSAYIAGLP